MNETTINFETAKTLVADFKTWHQRFEIFPGIVTPGVYGTDWLLERLNLPKTLTGLQVLDIGACDGYYSRELHKRGAAVTAFDYKSKNFSGFSIMERCYGHTIPHIHANIYELDTAVSGEFDLILFLGVLYHLPDLYRALYLIRKCCRGKIIIETESQELLDSPMPLVRYLPRDSANGDITNFWSPNSAAVKAILEDAGYTVTAMDRFAPSRLIVYAEANTSAAAQVKGDIAYGLLDIASPDQ